MERPFEAVVAATVSRVSGKASKLMIYVWFRYFQFRSSVGFVI